MDRGALGNKAKHRKNPYAGHFRQNSYPSCTMLMRKISKNPSAHSAASAPLWRQISRITKDRGHMPDSSKELRSSVFTKTAVGQQEIASRALGLSPLARRLLVLIDGRKSGNDLTPFVGDHDVDVYLNELLDHACVEITARVAPAIAPAPTPTDTAVPAQHAPAATDWLAVLPPAQTRSAKDLEMARNFMANTVNSIFGHNNRISLVESIFNSKKSAELRGVYPAWANALDTNSTGHKRLPELREKLFVVL